jgi:hypothetical protein
VRLENPLFAMSRLLLGYLIQLSRPFFPITKFDKMVASSWTVIYSIFLVVEFLSTSIGLAGFIYYRGNAAIQNRGFYSVIISNLGLFAYCLFDDIGFITEGTVLSCKFYEAQENFFLLLTMAFIVERCLMVIASFKFAVESQNLAYVLMQKDNSAVDDKEATLKANNALKWIRRKNYFHQGLFSASKQIALMICIAFNIPIWLSIGRGDECETIHRFSRLMTGACIGLFAVLTVFAIRSLRFVKENFKIKSELKFIGLAGFLGFTWVSVTNFAVKVADEQRVVSHVGYHMLLLINMWVTMWYVVYIVRKEFLTSKHNAGSRKTSSAESDNSSKNVVQQVADDLRRTLENPASCMEFEQFLVQEFAVESVLFWKAVQKYRHQYKQNTAAQSNVLARTIFDEYIPHAANLSINISAGCRNILIESFKNSNIEEGVVFSEDVFNNAAKEVFELMLSDPFRRFRRVRTVDVTAQSQNMEKPRSSLSLSVSQGPKSNKLNPVPNSPIARVPSLNAQKTSSTIDE